MALHSVTVRTIVFLSLILHVLAHTTPPQSSPTESSTQVPPMPPYNPAEKTRISATTVMSAASNSSISSPKSSTSDQSPADSPGASNRTSTAVAPGAPNRTSAAVAPGAPNRTSAAAPGASNRTSTAAAPGASNRTSTVPAPPAAQAWNTSVLCKHLANITGNKPLPVAENVVEEPIVAKCFPGFVCVNGICTGGMSCKCYDGWAGLFCQAPCPTDCAPEGRCMTSTNNQAICVCNETSKYTQGVGCVEKPPEFFTTSTPPPLTTPKNLRALSERECFGAFTCLHGYCQFSSLECTCDPGWKGQLCDQPCEMNCSGHGRCRESDEFILECVCDPNYSGQFCEIVLQRSLATSGQNSSHQKDAQVDMSGWYDQNTPASAKTRSGTDNKDETDNNTREGNSNGTETSMRPLSARECLPGVVCQYGYCEKGQKSCVCDEDWGGVTCNLTCDLSCGSKGACVINEGEEPFCRCHDGYDGKQCGDTEEDKPSVDVRVNTLVEDPWDDLSLQHGLMSPLVQRLCHPGFVCAYGICSKPVAGDVECICDPKFAGTYCQVPCPLVCDINRHCEYGAVSQTPECYCNPGYAGPNCTEEISEATSEPLSTAAIAALSSAILLLPLLTVCVALPIVLYRKGNIKMMKIVHSFRGYEEDDNKVYDAFIMYVSADLDRQFVIQTLVPKLEGRMCLTLCLQQRSLVPSVSTANNTVELARQSRRIILIVSPSFISSSCGSEEYRAVHQEMLREKHKIRLIVLGDINAAQSKTDGSLNRILNSARLLKYPGKHGSQQDYDNFWTRLELTMPKKRLNTLESGKGQSCLMSPSISSSLEPTQDPKAPLEIRLFTNGHLNTQLLQRIVRVPASNLDTSEKTAPVACAALDRILGRLDSDDSDIQEDTPGAFGASRDAYHRLRQPDPSTPNGIPNGIVNGGFEYSDSRHTNGLQSEYLSNGLGQTYTHDTHDGQ